MTSPPCPRERYALEGPEPFSDAQLLALILGPVPKGRGAGELAESLLDRFGGLRGLAAAPPESLTAVPGVGMAMAVRVHAALSLGRRPDPARADVIRDARAAWRVLRGGLQHLAHEELHALYLDRRGRLMHRRRISAGDDHHTAFDPRQVFRPAVALGAAAVVLGHNHPSGNLTPSSLDITSTRRCEEAARVLGLHLDDHLILGGEGFLSMREIGLLPFFDGASQGLAG